MIIFTKTTFSLTKLGILSFPRQKQLKSLLIEPEKKKIYEAVPTNPDYVGAIVINGVDMWERHVRVVEKQQHYDAEGNIRVNNLTIINQFNEM